MSELDELERELLVAADTWFSQRLHGKLQRLISIARENKSTSNPTPEEIHRRLMTDDTFEARRFRMEAGVSEPVDESDA